MADDKPSIAELQRVFAMLHTLTRSEVIAQISAAPALLEISAAAIARRDAACSCGAELGCFPDCDREIAERALLAALARVRS